MYFVWIGSMLWAHQGPSQSQDNTVVAYSSASHIACACTLTTWIRSFSAVVLGTPMPNQCGTPSDCGHHKILLLVLALDSFQNHTVFTSVFMSRMMGHYPLMGWPDECRPLYSASGCCSSLEPFGVTWGRYISSHYLACGWPVHLRHYAISVAPTGWGQVVPVG